MLLIGVGRVLGVRTVEKPGKPARTVAELIIDGERRNLIEATVEDHGLTPVLQKIALQAGIVEARLELALFGDGGIFWRLRGATAKG